MKTLSIIAALVMGIITQSSLAAAEVNIYSYRKPALIEPILDAFSENTGIKVNLVHAEKGMLERLRSEGMNTPADLVFTVDIGRLTDLKNADLTQAVTSEVLNTNIPASQRDAENHWFGITQRARIIVTSKDRVQPGEILNYEDLASDALKGRVCTRSGKHPYMVALTAAMMTHHGKVGAEKWLEGVKNNLARKPQGNDRAQVKAIKQGECDVAVINHYYMINMLNDPAQAPIAEAVNVVFPNQEGDGTHMNISGMAMTKHTQNTELAQQLMEFLASSSAQKMYADLNGEYPVQKDIESTPGSHMAEWGAFKRDNVALTEVAANRAEAIKMMDRVGYDN